MWDTCLFCCSLCLRMFCSERPTNFKVSSSSFKTLYWFMPNYHMFWLYFLGWVSETRLMVMEDIWSQWISCIIYCAVQCSVLLHIKTSHQTPLHFMLVIPGTDCKTGLQPPLANYGVWVRRGSWCPHCLGLSLNYYFHFTRVYGIMIYGKVLWGKRKTNV